jgi:hypothetical protein
MNETSKPKPEVPLPSQERQISPALKSWLDNVLIPAMVELYIIENNLGVKNTKTSHQDQQKPDAERSKT